jgi:hypothetical protein
MKDSGLVIAVAMAPRLAGCGGDTSHGTATTSAQTLAFVPPALNSQRSYADTITDNSNNKIDESYYDMVTAVDASGSYTVYQSALGGGASTVNGADYSVLTETLGVNNSGEPVTASHGGNDGNPVVCTYTPHGAGPTFPLTVGANWTLDFTYDCPGQPAIAYMQTGTVVGVESVTVPAGTTTPPDGSGPIVANAALACPARNAAIAGFGILIRDMACA